MSRWTQQDVTRHELKRANAAAAITTPSKYRNVKVMVDGFRFDSKHEATIYQGLILRQRAGEIRDLRCQVRFPLYAPALQEIARGSYESAQVSEYVADFVYVEVSTERCIVVDAKGLRTQVYRLKKKWLELQEAIIIEEV